MTSITTPNLSISPYSQRVQAHQRQGDLILRTTRSVEKTIATKTHLNNALENWDAHMPQYLKSDDKGEMEKLKQALYVFVGKAGRKFDLKLQPHKSPMVISKVYDASIKEHVHTIPFSFKNDKPGLKHSLPVVRTRVIDELNDVSNSLKTPEGKKQMANTSKPSTDPQRIKDHITPEDYQTLNDAQQLDKLENQGKKHVKDSSKTPERNDSFVVMTPELLQKLKQQDKNVRNK